MLLFVYYLNRLHSKLSSAARVIQPPTRSDRYSRDVAYHSEALPEIMWRKDEYFDWKKTKKRSKDDVTPEELAVLSKMDEQAAAEAVRAAEEKAARLHHEAEQRDATRRKCMFSSEKRRWGSGDDEWTCKRQKSETRPVPKLCELAELALQSAFEKRCEDLQLEESIRGNMCITAPIQQNCELCRIFQGVPAVEMWTSS